MIPLNVGLVCHFFIIVNVEVRLPRNASSKLKDLLMALQRTCYYGPC